MYLHLPRLTNDKKTLDRIAAKQRVLNGYAEVDYEAVVAFKTEITREIFKSAKKEFLKDPTFVEWFEDNESWLAAYALFCVLRDKHDTADFFKWPEHTHISAQKITELTRPESEYYERVAYYYFIQFHLHLQLKEASE